MEREQIKLAFVNVIGIIGYLFCMMQWLWTVMLFLPAILETSFIKNLSQEPIVSQPSQQFEVSTIGIIFAIIVTAVALVASIYIFIKMPSNIGKTGSTITHETTKLALPIITHHKKLPRKKQIQLTTRFLFIIKITFCVIPFVIMLFSYNIDINIPRTVIAIVGTGLAICSIIFFTAQAISAKLLNVDYRKAR